MNHAIVACARGWIGTRFHHQGRLKKTASHRGGVDCLGLLIGVARELNLRSLNGRALAAFDETGYSHMPDTARLKARLSELLTSIPMPGIEPGNVVLLQIDNSPQHMGIVSDARNGLGIIHAYAPARAVVEHLLDGWWVNRIDTAFRII